MRSKSELQNQLSQTRAKIAETESALAALEESIRLKRKDDLTGARAYSESARKADEAKKADLEKTLADLRESIPLLEEGIEEAHRANVEDQVANLEAEMRELCALAAARFKSLLESWKAYLDLDSEIFDAFKRWQKCDGDRRKALAAIGAPGAPANSTGACPTPPDAVFPLERWNWQNFQDRNKSAHFDPRYTDRLPGWVHNPRRVG